jgi:protein ImuB
LFGCIHIPNFVCQAILRLEPEICALAVVVVEGVPPLVHVTALNTKARKAGLFEGMTKTEAEGYGDVVFRERSPDLERSAHAALLDCAQKFSPRIEDVQPDTVILDLSGLRKLLGTPAEIAHGIREQARALSLHARIGIAANVDTALFAACGTRGILVVPDGQEAQTLRDFPLALLNLDIATAETFRKWGIHRFGQLCDLPTLPLAERLGQKGLRLQLLARGQSPRVLSPTTPPQEFVETMEFDEAVSDIESLAFVIRLLLDQLCARLLSRALAAAELQINLTLNLAHEDAVAETRMFARSIKLPIPSTDTKSLLKLIQLDLAAHPPGAQVQKLRIEADALRPQHLQEGMFVPQGPEPQQLQVTLARLRKIVGEDRAGSPEIIEQHTTQTFRMVHFTPDTRGKTGSKRRVKKSALRVYRPPRPAQVWSDHGAPASVRFENQRYRVGSAAGPWRRSGQWWTEHRWGRDEWDLVLTKGDEERLVVKAYRNLVNGSWFIEGQYD